MLFKSTLRLLIVETDTKELLVPVVANSYKKTLWLLHHREPTARAIGVVEGPFSDISFMHVGEINIPTLHNQITRTTNALYTSIGKQPITVDTFDLDFTLSLDAFIIKYSKLFTPDEFLIVLGIGHNKLFRNIARLVVNKDITYSPGNGQGKWSYYDYYWLNEKYKASDAKNLDIKPFLNRTNLQIRQRAFAVGFTTKITKRIISGVGISIATPTTKETKPVVLSDVQRDYMLTQITDIVNNILNKRKS